MTLTHADRQRIIAAFRERIGTTELPAYTTVHDLCANLLLAIPALVETCEILVATTRCHCGGTLPCMDATCEIGYAATSRIFAELLAPFEKRAVDAEQTYRLAIDAHTADKIRLETRIRELTAQLESDPCP